MSSGYIPTREQSERIGRAVGHYERTAALLPPLEQRRIVGGGSGQSCTNVLRIFVWTNADPDDITGTITIPFTYDSENGSATYNYNDTLATVESQFEGAVTTLATDDVTATGVILTGALDVTFPDMSLLVCPRSGVEVTHTLADGNGTPIRVTAMVCCS